MDFMNNLFEDLGRDLSLKERVYVNIKSQIIKGNLEPNTRLREEEISSAMNISRAPIREALNKLEKEGFVVIVSRKGAKVANFTIEDIKNIWEMRRLMEPYAAKISVDKITKDELENINIKFENILKMPNDFDAYINSDLELHELFYKYLSNKLMKDILIMIKEHSLRIRYLAEKSEYMRKDVVLQTTNEHIKIVKALRLQDPELVYNLVFKHVINSEKRTLLPLDI